MLTYKALRRNGAAFAVIAATDQIACDAGAMTITETGGTSKTLPNALAAKITGDALGRVPSSKTAFIVRNVAFNSNGRQGIQEINGYCDNGSVTFSVLQDTLGPNNFRRTYVRINSGTIDSTNFIEIQKFNINPVSRIQNRYVCAAGKTYEAWGLPAGSLETCYARFMWYNAAGVFLSSSDGVAVAPATASSTADPDTFGNKAFVIAVAPTNAASYYVSFVARTTSTKTVGDTIGVSAVQTGRCADGQGEPSNYVPSEPDIYRYSSLNIYTTGVEDARANLLSLDGVRSGETIELLPGVYRIASSVTLAAHYRIPKGVMFKPDSGVTITFSGGITAGSYQIFDLSAGGAIAGLDDCQVDWFHSLKNTGTDCIAASQKAYDAVVDSGTVNWGIGTYTAGGGQILANRGQQTIGRGRYATKIRWSTTTTNFIKFTGGIPHHRFEGFSFGLVNYANRPTAGQALYVDVGNVYASNFDINSAYDGVYFTSSGFANRFTQFNVSECRNTNIYLNNSSDCFLTNFISSSLADTVTLTGQSGTFTSGEQITVSGTAYKGWYYLSLGSNKHRLVLPITNPTTSTTITGVTSGATATFSSVDYDMQLGNVRIVGQCEAVILENADCVGGLYALTTASTDGTFTRGKCPAFCKFTNVFFDSAHNGVQLAQIAPSSFVNCWSYAHNNHGFNIGGPTNGIKIVDCEIGACGGWGVVIGNNNLNLDVVYNNITLNAIGGITTGGSGNKYFNLSFNKFNVDFSQPGVAQGYAITLNSGCGDYFVMTYNVAVGVATNSYADASGGTNKITTPNL